MCGIVGVIDFRSPIDHDRLVRMRDTLAHRGPDDAGIWIDETGSPFVGLGHRRLAILDLSESGRQPMTSRDGRLLIIFNGEIYNYLELIPQLEAHGHRFRTGTDTEVLLAAYETWGPECCRRFNGAWAFAVWDKAERRLFASRDRFGKKPFYYYWDGRLFAFASEMKALFQHPAISCRPHTPSLENYCESFAVECGPQTMFEGIKRLEPAHQLLLDRDGRLSIEQYWQIDPDHTVRLATTEDYVGRFRELFADAVKVRLRSNVPVGSSLSGGLDSSLIVGSIADWRRQGVGEELQKTFSARYPQYSTVDEGPFINAVVQKTGVEAHFTLPSPDDLLAQLDALHYHQEEPFLSTSPFAQWQVMRCARRHDTTVLLDGQGADEILAGYSVHLGIHLLETISRGNAWRALREYRQFARRQAATARLYSDYGMRSHPVDARVLLKGGLRWLRQGSLRRYRGAETGADGIRPSFTGRGKLFNRLYHDLTHDSIPVLLRYADRSSMAHAVEVRNPFLDYRLVEYVMAIPDELKIHDGWQKFILREAGSDLLPEIVRRRADKVGFATPEDEWLRGDLRTWAEGILFGRRLSGLEGYPLDKIRKQWQRHQSRRANLRAAFWPWISLHEWLSMLEAGRFVHDRPSRQRTPQAA